MLKRVSSQDFLSVGEGTYMGNADTTVNGESCGQILIEAVEPWPVHFIHQLSHPNDL